MDTTKKIELCGKTISVPANIEEFKSEAELLELKQVAVSIEKIALFWGLIYTLAGLDMKDLFLTALAIYFLYFYFSTRKTFSARNFLYHSIVVFIIAISNLIDISTHSYSNAYIASWFFIAIFQFWHSFAIFRLYRKSIKIPTQPTVDDSFKSLTSLVKTVAKIKPRKNDHVFELSISYLKRIKFLVAEKYVIGIDVPHRRIFSVLDRDDFAVKKIKKVLIEKKYVVELELNHKKIKTVIPIRDFEKLEKLSLAS